MPHPFSHPTRLLLLALLACPCRARAADHSAHFRFSDITESTGLLPHVANIRAHAAGWGDADNDGFVDLYVATFHTEQSKPNLFFRNKNGRFALDDQPALGISTRATASLFADLDNDGDLDLYVSSMPAPEGSRLARKEGHPLRGCSLFRNDGRGVFTDISSKDGKDNAACPPSFGGRSATTLDFDGDSLLDLLVGEDPLPGYNGSTTRSTRLFKNKGNLQFEDVTQAAGIPSGIPGYGVAAADVNNDTLPDLFIAANDGGNRLFLNAGQGKFREADTGDTFKIKDSGGDNMITGVTFGDVNRDGLLDIVLGPHFASPWKSPVPVRLYLNRGLKDNVPTFEDITEKAGLIPLPMKAPHVELQDFDNDGLPDLSTTIVKFKDGKPHPLIFKHTGLKDGLPLFKEDTLALNDFPTPEDRKINRSGQLFDKLLQDKKILYTAPGPSADFNNDGKLDLFLASWFPSAPSMLLRNDTPAGSYLKISLRSAGKTNRTAIGARINVRANGQLIATREISTSQGYASSHAPLAHFGLGAHDLVDLEIILPHNQGIVHHKNIKTNQHLTLDIP